MLNPQFVDEGWYPQFIDYFTLSFSAATAFSPTDVSAIKPWAKSLMMLEEALSLDSRHPGRRPRREHPQVGAMSQFSQVNRGERFR